MEAPLDAMCIPVSYPEIKESLSSKLSDPESANVPFEPIELIVY